MVNTEKTISDFLSNEYKNFAFYTIENRAIPSVIDGFKPTHRKIIHVANDVWRTGNEKPLKIFQLAGKVASDCFYHHGNASLEQAIITMAQSFKNNAPLLDEVGQFGSLRSPDPGAPRYIGTRLNENFRLIYKDSDLLRYKSEEGEVIEPEYFLPILPTILLNGGQGIAVGFSSNILNRSIPEILEATINAVKGKKVKDVAPSLNSFKGTYTQDTENPKKWYIRGNYTLVNAATIKVTELPPSMTYEKYDNYLDDLVDKKTIVSYEDNSKENIEYVIRFTKDNLENLIKEDKLNKLLKLEDTETENFNTLNEDGKLMSFETSAEIIKYFVSFRLTYYDKRKAHLINKIEREISILSNRAKFIKAIIDGKLKVNNIPKLEIIKGIEKMKIDMIDDSYDYLLRMPIYSLTKEVYEKLLKDIETKNIELSDLKSTDPRDMYISDLNELKKKIK